MAHKVAVQITNHPLSREENGVDFHVEDNDGKLGELKISKGGIRWKPRGRRDHHFMSWEDLDQFMKGQPRR